MTSVIYVDLSSDSEEEEGLPEAKRSRREQGATKVATSKSLTKHAHAAKTSITQLSVGIKASAATGDAVASGMVVGTYKSMHIPSGITVTKHNIKNSFSNGSIKNVNPFLSVENNNNNNNNNNKNSVKSKPIKSTATQNTSVSKTSNTMATITSVTIPQPCKLSAMPTVLQKNITQPIQKSVSQLTMATTVIQKSVMTTPTTPIQQNTLTAAPVALKCNQFQQQPQPKLTAPSMLPAQLQHQQQQQQQEQQYPQKTTLTITHQKTTSTPTVALNQQQSILAITQQRLQAMHTLQKPTAHTQVQQQPRPEVQLSITPKLTTTQKLPQRLPIVQKQPLTPMSPTTTSTTMTTLMQLKENQELKQPPLSALNATTLSVRKLKHQHQQRPHQEGTSKPTLPANYSISCSNNPTSPSSTTPILSKLQTMAMANVNCDSAARTLPYKTKASTRTTIAATTIRTVQSLASSNSITAGTIQSTPPSRLLASPPPHCIAALNEPLLLNLPATTSITPQLTPTTTPPPTAASPIVTAVAGVKLQAFPAACITQVKKTLGKRVQPITVLQKSDEEWRKHMAQQQQLQLQPRQKLKNSANTPTIVLVESPPTTPPTENVEPDNTKRTTSSSSISSASVILTQPTTAHSCGSRAPLVGEYATLLQLCREHDRSKDMQRLIDNKLIKYYYSVHESFVRSRGFRKQLLQAMERIRTDPDMIYVHLKCVVEELKVRRKAKVQEQVPQKTEPCVSDKATVVAPDAISAVASLSVDNPGPDPAAGPCSGNRRTEERIRKLNRTLYTITKRISALEEADVDWNDDDDSSYLQVERYKKRACQIYEKICDLTGESKSAHRQMKQPILFKDSPYPQFNRTLSAFVNRMHEFPDYYDVLKLLEHCNKEKELGLASFEMKRIAHDAFVKVGRLLQARRKTDLYETVTHFTANAKDPAASDATLLAKLNENSKKQTKISDILEKFAREQELTAEEQREARQKEKELQTVAAETTISTVDAVVALLDNNRDEKPCTSAQAAQQHVDTSCNDLVNGVKIHQESENENDSESGSEKDEEEEDESYDESDEDVDIFVDNFKANGEVSDADSDVELNATPKNLAATAHVIVNNVTRVKTAVPKVNIDDCVGKETFLQVAPNGELTDVPTAHTLKIMSVSSLNASVSATNDNNNTKKNSIKSKEQLQQQQKKQQTKIALDAQIIISDEES